MFLKTGDVKICRKLTGEHACRSVISETYSNSSLKVRIERKYETASPNVYNPIYLKNRYYSICHKYQIQNSATVNIKGEKQAGTI